jgi:hypothetical protein
MWLPGQQQQQLPWRRPPVAPRPCCLAGKGAGPTCNPLARSRRPSPLLHCRTALQGLCNCHCNDYDCSNSFCVATRHQAHPCHWLPPLQTPAGPQELVALDQLCSSTDSQQDCEADKLSCMYGGGGQGEQPRWGGGPRPVRGGPVSGAASWRGRPARHRRRRFSAPAAGSPLPLLQVPGGEPRLPGGRPAARQPQGEAAAGAGSGVQVRAQVPRPWPPASSLSSAGRSCCWAAPAEHAADGAWALHAAALRLALCREQEAAEGCRASRSTAAGVGESQQ